MTPDESIEDISPATTSNVEDRARMIAETASDGIITIDENSTILFANRAAELIFGYSEGELIGNSLTVLMPEYLRHIHRSGLKRYLQTGEKHISWEAAELPGRHKNGEEILLELSFGEFITNGHRYFTGVARDVTERKRAEAERERLLSLERSARLNSEAITRQLKKLQVVTDGALAHLSLNELFDELLNRTREALEVDTVAILLLERKGDDLVAWAAKGLEEEVEHGVHVPFGKGFAGRIAAEQRPIIKPRCASQRQRH